MATAYHLRIPTRIASELVAHQYPGERLADLLPDERPGWSRATFTNKAAAIKATNTAIRTWRHHSQIARATGRTAKRDVAFIRDTTGALDKWDLYRRKARGPAYVGSVELVTR